MLQPLPRRQEEREGTHGSLHPLGPRKKVGERRRSFVLGGKKKPISLEPADEVGAAEQGFVRSMFRPFWCLFKILGCF